MIATSTLDGICEAVTRYGLSPAGISEVRALFADVHLVFCLDDEMGAAQPYRSYAGFCLYLIHSGGHCMGLTEGPDSAFGLVIAEVEPD
mgnify:FL=1|tara:strand:- start:337 stop:603 length:267 start_codon:yes stop_codon:yes gene_type:complete